MVGRLVLVQVIGVRVPVGQQTKKRVAFATRFCVIASRDRDENRRKAARSGGGLSRGREYLAFTTERSTMLSNS